MLRSQSEVDEYYNDLTKFINENSGLDPVLCEQVKWVCRLNKKFRNRTHEPYDPMADPHRASRCTARRSDGEPCRAYRIPGAVVCRKHGGAAKQVLNSARIRLQNAADRLARELLKMTTDDNVADHIKLAAIKDALDRGGVSAKAELEITAKPFESIMERMELGVSRAQHRRSMGIPDDTPALAAANDEPIEAQIVDDLDDVDVGDLYGANQTITPDDDERRFPFNTEPPAGGLMTMEQSMSEIARLRREAVARIRHEQRALPPGNSAHR